MKIYTEVNPNVFTIGNICIQSYPGNRHFIQMLAEVDAGEARIIPYVEPPPNYVDDRALAYGSLGNQLDMQYHDSVDGTTTWLDHVAAVKAAHPKD